MGVILLAAIAVTLAAVIGAFATGLSDRVQDYAPSSQFSFDYEAGDQTGNCILSDGTNSDDRGKLTIIHESGDTITASQLAIIDGEGNSQSWNSCSSNTSTEIRSGDQAAPEIDVDDTLRLVWVSENDKDDTAVIARYEGPEA